MSLPFSTSLRYKPRLRLQKQHVDTITALEFSLDGSVLASCGMDGKIVCWSTKTGQAMYIVRGGTGMTSLAWITSDSLVAGEEDGGLVVVKITEVDLSATTFRPHTTALECLAYEDGKLATGSLSEIKIWRLLGSERLQLLSDLLLPPRIVNGNPARVISVHWAAKRAPGTLLASYLHHGIVIWNTANATVTRHIGIPSLIGDSALSPTHTSLAISTISTAGFEIHDLVGHKPPKRFSYGCAPSSKLCLPILFIHRGNAIIGGSSIGKLRLWDADCEHPIHVLEHEGADVILALADYYDRTLDKFFIATGTAGLAYDTYIIIWQAEPLIHTDRRPFTTGPAMVGKRKGKSTQIGLSHVCVAVVLSIALLAVWKAAKA